jgi:hypothetical protein
MEPQEILEDLFDSKVLAVIKFFIKNDDEYYLREISRLTKVSTASTFRILNKLTRMKILKMREIKTAKLYTLETNKTTEFLKSILEVDYVDYFIDKASLISGVEEILLLGSKTKSKANVLILGSDIDSAEIKMLTGEIKDKYNFSLNQMTLAREQFEQMSAMGLYPGEKKVLFKK